MSQRPPIPFTLCGHDFGSNSFINLSQGDEPIQKFEGGRLDSLYPQAIEVRDRRNAEIGVSDNLRQYWENYGPGGSWETRPDPPEKLWIDIGRA